MRIILLSWLFFITFSTNFFGIPVILVSGQCQSEQQSLLLQLKNSLLFNSTLSVRLMRWNQSTDCCTWSGVDCDIAGRVIGLDLSKESICGGVDNSTDLFALQHLRSLNLASNLFDEAQIPSRLANLTNLTYLNLSDAGFVGQIPIEISSLTRLVTLDLSCSFKARLQLENPNLKVLVQNFSELRELYLDRVIISALGNEWCQALSSSLPNLQVLSLSNCYLSGPIHSSLADLQSLSVIRLDANDLSSPVPEFLADFPSLTILSLSICGLYGKLPENIFKVPTLETLDLSFNFLLHGSFPNFPQNNSLRTLMFHWTNLSGTLPHSIGNLKSLSKLDLASCEFTGPLPISMGNLTQLEYVDLSSNHFTGPLPPSMGNLTQLEHLALSSNHFTGPLPPSMGYLTQLEHVDLSSNHFTGPLPPSMGNLTQFEHLDLSWNSFTGQLHPSMGNLTQLEYLKLTFNNFSGPLPPSMGNLTQLEYVDLSFNNFSGFIPSFHMSRSLNHLSLSSNCLIGGISSTDWEQLHDLVDVHLSNNSLNGSIPPSLFALPLLHSLQLTDNQFVGQIPEFLNASAVLYDLGLSVNRLEGPIPMSIFELKNLQFLNLASNKFNGTVQLDVIGRLGKLSWLDLSNNNLAVNVNTSFSSFPPNLWYLKLASCKLVMIPNLKKISSIEVLDLSDNQISGEIPNWIWKVSIILNLSHNSLVGFQEPYSIKNLGYLDLHSNQLQGKIPLPPPLALIVDYSTNNFTSSIPDDIGNIAPSMKLFSVSNNKLTGVIPESLCKASSLQVLDLSINNLSGRIPTCLIEMGENLGVLNVRRNNLYGTIPDRFPGNCGFQTLSMNSNQLEGLVPKSLANCTKLEVLDLGNNKINDGFPCWLKKVSSLHVLGLRSNKFYGNISCLEYDVSWPMLQIIDLASNNFTGRLPQKGLTTWEAMMVDEQKAQSQPKHLQFEVTEGNQHYQDAVTVTMKGLEMELVKILTVFTSIDLSSNNFNGQIPEEVGLFKSLIVLNLSQNAFTGSIPSSVGNLRQLESLDLSMNNLGRHIPTQLASLNFLAVLNLSYNHLVGRIPTSTQLQSFSPTSFEGNEGLCGPPLLKSCSNSNNSTIPDPSKNNEFDWRFFLVIGVGFGTGFVAAVAPLIFSDKANLWYDIVIHKFLRQFMVFSDKVNLWYYIVIHKFIRRFCM